jgi:hypothetical protein
MSRRANYATCEPIRAWNRLESRARKQDFEQATRAEIADPLWLLGRQWQFGEFKGEDTGSAIFTQLLYEKTEISHYQNRKNGVLPEIFSDKVLPLEVLVESETILPDYRARAQAGKHWLKLLTQQGKLYNLTMPPIRFDEAAYTAHLLKLYPITLPTIAPTDTPDLKIQKAQVLTNRGLLQFIEAVAPTCADGIALYEDFEHSLTEVTDRLALDVAHKGLIANAYGSFRLWAEKRFSLTTARPSAWQPEQLEYSFECLLPEKGGKHIELEADEYYQGTLDWYNFNVNIEPGTTPSGVRVEPSEHLLQVMPTEVRYAGMPNNRWWAFEDSRVDLGNINAETTEIAKVIVSQFALIYGNNWLIVPCELPVGSLTTVRGLVVTDVFGFQHHVKPANQGLSSDWQGWGLFNLTKQADDLLDVLDDDTRMFLPPTLHKTLESEPVETVHFVRDEMANYVWGIEGVVPDLMGRGQDGHAAAIDLSNWIKPYLPPPAVPFSAPVKGTLLHYKLMTTVPENWIPFLPVHIPGQLRDIRLQRASMPRFFDDLWSRVRPRTAILRAGLHTSDGVHLPDALANNQLKSYFLHEEEVPRTGVKVVATHQRVRWYNGRILNWYGRKKTMGRGEAASGLVFDKIERLAGE